LRWRLDLRCLFQIIGRDAEPMGEALRGLSTGDVAAAEYITLLV